MRLREVACCLPNVAGDRALLSWEVALTESKVRKNSSFAIKSL